MYKCTLFIVFTLLLLQLSIATAQAGNSQQIIVIHKNRTMPLDTLGAYYDTTNHFSSFDSILVRCTAGTTSCGWLGNLDTFRIDTTSAGGGDSSLWADSSTYITPVGYKGIVGHNCTLYGNQDSTFVCLGVENTAGNSRYTRTYITISGGWLNEANADYATVGGGRQNRANYAGATVAGGMYNQATNNYCGITGGYENLARGQHDFIGGGRENWTSSSYSYQVISGGNGNKTNAYWATIAGGDLNTVNGDCSFTTGYSNYISTNGDYSILFGVYDSLSVDSTFCVGRKMHAELRGGVRVGSSGGDIEILQIWVASDTMWARTASDTFYILHK